MGRGVIAQQCVLHEEDTDGRDVGVGRSQTPAFPPTRPRAIVECRENEMSRLQSRSFRQDGNGKAGYAKTLQDYGGVDQVPERANAEEIDGAMGDEDDGEDTQGAPSGRAIPVDDFCGCGDQVGQRKIDGGGDGDLA